MTEHTATGASDGFSSGAPRAHPAGPVAITGASGMIGSALSRALRERGQPVIHLVRHSPAAADELPPGVRQVRWSPGSDLDPRTLQGISGLVHLAGAGIGDRRWTTERKRELVDSRVRGTDTIARAMAELPDSSAPTDEALRGSPGVRLLSGSAIGYYGDRRDEELTEDSAPGEGFLADLVRRWEEATTPAREQGVPVAHLRTGIVLNRQGGALGKLMPLARAGLAGPLGGGQQYWSWITLHDHVRAMLFLLDRPEPIVGPVNLTGPHPDTQKAVVAALGHQLHRPAVVPAPTLALRLALGEMAGEILGSQRALPRVLAEAGFTFDHPDLATAMSWVVQRHSHNRQPSS